MPEWGQSHGTETLTCGVHPDSESVSELKLIVGYPVGLGELLSAEKLHEFDVNKKKNTHTHIFCVISGIRKPHTMSHGQGLRTLQVAFLGDSRLFSTHHRSQPGFSDRETHVGGAGATKATKKKHQRGRRKTRRLWNHQRQEETVQQEGLNTFQGRYCQSGAGVLGNNQRIQQHRGPQ